MLRTCYTNGALMTLRIEPYKTGSKGAKALAARTGILRATRKQVAKHGDFDTILNWGNSERRFEGDYINNPEAVAVASNKLRSYTKFGEAHVPTVPWTTESDAALHWLTSGRDVIARCQLRGSGGAGIHLIHHDTLGRPGRTLGRRGILEAPLYTQYVKKADEYRVHVFDGEVIDVQQKRKRQEVNNDDVNYQIRNSDNGWVYCRGGVDAPSAILSASRRAVSCLGLDFGAVDVGWNAHNSAAVVYEVNTAPGLEGTTLDKYFMALSARLPCLSGGAYARRRR
jgi:glutathione synthase/RimK-type ligase-like ATP-grasp enzyme